MSYTRIAHAAPFEGAPKLQNPAMYGASPNKPILYRIPVLGARPMRISIPTLPDGLTLSDKGILSGSLPEGDYSLTVIAENALGRDERPFRLEIHPDHLLLTPLLGFTSWNAFVQYPTQDKMSLAAKIMDESGLAEYGYSYINTDSAWQGEYGGQYDAIMPGDNFPDMKGLVDEIHSRGFKFGIYSTPMLHALGKPPERKTPLPGCTRGEPDPRFADTVFGCGIERMEDNNVAQWTDWEVDYLKYDWRPTDVENADLMKQALLKSSRDIAYCVTVASPIENADYWKQNCTSWRANRDSMDFWSRLMLIFDSYDAWIPHIGKGHFFDLDMLELGYAGMNMMDERQTVLYDHSVCPCRLTEDEQILAFTMRAFLLSPIQISSHLDRMTDFERDIYCNEEILAIHRDELTSPAVVCLDRHTGDTHLKVYERPLADGSYAQAIFNVGETVESFLLDKASVIRDVWAKENITDTELTLPPHTVRVLKFFR